MSETPSYLPDDCGIDAETDNSHLFEAEIDALSVAEVENGGAEVHIPPQHDVESELSEIRTENPKPRNKFGLSAFANHITDRAVTSDAGNMASHGFWLVDKYHSTDADTMREWEFTAEVSNARIDGMSVAERLEAGRKQVFDAAYKLAEDFNALRENRMPDYGDYEEAAESDLRAMTDYATWWKTVFQVYMGARVEELTGEVLCEALGLDEWVAHSDKVREMTGVETPEAAGIDLYLPGVDKTVQVKRGDGGKPRGDYDWLVRYKAPDNDGKKGRDARLEITTND